MTNITFKARLLAAAGLSSVLMAMAAPALAQDEATTVDDVVVTLQKREQVAKDVPAAVTAYSGKFLDQVGIQDFSDLSQFTPGFEVQDQSPNNPGFVMRGITSDSLDSFNEPRVSVFQDGVSISKAAGSFIELHDVERVEIAKGPQSTLFGRGALIGAVNVIQNKANPAAFDASARVEGGSLNDFMAEGMVNMPVGDSFAVRLSGRVKQRDGYVDNLAGGDALNSRDVATGRLALAWTPNERLRADVIFNYEQDSPTGTSFKSINFLPTDAATGAVLGDTRPGSGAALSVPAGFQGGKDLGLDRQVGDITGIVRYDLTDDLTLTSTTAFRRFHAVEIGDADGVALPILAFENNSRGKQWSQEFRVNWDNGGRFSWFAGADYFKESGSDATPAQFDERMALAQLAGQLSAPGVTGFASNRPAPASVFGITAFTGALVQGLVFQQSNGHILLDNATSQAIAANLKPAHLESATNDSTLKSWDLFGDLTFKATDKLEFSAGLRYTADDKTTGFRSSVSNGYRSVLGGVIGSAQLAANGAPANVAQANAILGALAAPGAANIPPSGGYPVPMFGLTFQPTANNGDRVSQDLSTDGFTWRVTALYRATDDINLYANYARGRRPEVLSVGGPSVPFGAPRFNELPAETVDSYETGIKGDLFDRRLRFDAAIYYYKYDNFQTVEQQGTLFVISNAGAAKSYGLETQAYWRVTPTIDLFGTYAYSHARFDAGAYEGNHFRLSPDHSLSLGGSFRMQALGGEFDLRPTYTWQSKVYFDDNNDLAALQQPPRVFVADNTQDEVQDGYGLANLRLSYQPASAPWKIEGFVNNAFDEEYIIDAGNTGDSLGLPTAIAGAPRTWGFAVSTRF